jgi:hypothetical protein
MNKGGVAMTPNEVVKFAADSGAKMLDLRFMDFPGLWQHITVPISEFNEEVFEDGYGFDGSSIRGWQAINASDMLIIPDPATAKMDPFMSTPTLVMICDIQDPITRENYSRDPRNIAKRRSPICKPAALPTPRTSARKPSFSSLTTSALTPRSIPVTTSSTRSRANGIPAAKKVRIWATNPATKRAISRCRQRTACTTSAPKWCW